MKTLHKRCAGVAQVLDHATGHLAVFAAMSRMSPRSRASACGPHGAQRRASIAMASPLARQRLS
jgi:hypothetical protein